MRRSSSGGSTAGTGSSSTPGASITPSPGESAGGKAGADGIFFATVDWGSQDLLTAEQHREWARPTDLRLMRAAAGARFITLHVCKRRNLLAKLADYPAHAFSWAATDPTNPTLAEGLRIVRGAVMGGLTHEGPLQAADPSGALEEFRRALAETGGGPWRAGLGARLPPPTPAANLH